IDAWVDSEELLRYYLSKHPQVDIKITPSASKVSYVGGMLFNKEQIKSKEMAAFISRGLVKLRASGKLTGMFAKYGLKDRLQLPAKK
ncbi:MAG: hypothetical protein HRU25_10180, partial [Psychrobium sp.]|nr:hypothetical protein [Psychrobium sp.]